ncbi:MAG: peptidase MA family metallohydrolase [Chloroflexota bacterium]
MAGGARWLIAAVLALLLAGGAPPALADGWQEIPNARTTIRHTAETAADAAWYAAIADESYVFVCDVLGQECPERVGITLYQDEVAYAAVAPVAGRTETVLGHSALGTGEVGLAAWRLRPQHESLRRDTLIHELTHVVLGRMSANKLPISFQEGLAQYFERTPEQRSSWAETLRRAGAEGQLLRLQDLSRQRAFLQRPQIAYSQSYAMVAILSERYGLGKVLAVAELMGKDATLEQALTRSFGRSVEELDAELLAALPGFLEAGWDRNELDLWTLALPDADLAAERYEDARGRYARAARTFESVGRLDLAQRAANGANRAQAGLDATEATRQGQQALANFDYTQAETLLTSAAAHWRQAVNAERAGQVSRAAEAASAGRRALADVEQANAALERWDLAAAERAASQAHAALAELGDGAGAASAERVLDQVDRSRRLIGVLTAAAGLLGLAAVTLVIVLGRARRSRPATPPAPAGAQAGSDTGWRL